MVRRRRRRRRNPILSFSIAYLEKNNEKLLLRQNM
jgi:hypothetical protein